MHGAEVARWSRVCVVLRLATRTLPASNGPDRVRHAAKYHLQTQSIRHLESRRVLRPRAAPVIHASAADARDPQPFLHLGNVGVVLQRAGGSSGAQRMRPHALARDADLGHVKHRNLGIHRAGGERCRQRAGLGGADAPEQRADRLLAMAAGHQVFGHQAQRVGMDRQVPQLAALALHAQVRDAPALLGKVFYPQLR